MKKLFYLTAALVAAVCVFVWLTLPPHRVALPPATDGTVAGIVHVHTNRSDGMSSPDEVAAAAARAGLKFIVFADHGDATRPPDPPAYRSGVLCLEGVEISTTGGHYIAIDMPASPYPLGGEGRDVVEDVRRLGGFGIAAHPDSPKPELRWTDWTAPFDGVELINPDTSWRVLAARPGIGSKGQLLAASLRYPFRAPEVIASLMQPSAALEPWAAVARMRRVVTIAGADAHARLASRNDDPADGGFALPLPGYEASFRVLSIHVRTDRPLSNDALTDALVLTRAIRNGHLYTAIDGFATPPSLEVTATNALGTVGSGDVLAAGGPLTLRVKSNAPRGYTTRVFEGTRVIAAAADAQDWSVHASDEPGVYWAEISSPTATWLRSNPVYVRGPAAPAVPPRPPVIETRPLFDGNSVGGWRVEHDPLSVGAIEVAQSTTGPEIRYRFGLAGGAAVGQFTALVYDLPSGVDAFDRAAFTIRAERAMRVSIQVRDTTADRWRRSVYLDVAPQERSVPFEDLTPVGVTHAPKPARDAIRSIMFVVDTTNTKPGTSGRIWIKGVALQR